MYHRRHGGDCDKCKVYPPEHGKGGVHTSHIATMSLDVHTMFCVQIGEAVWTFRPIASPRRNWLHAAPRSSMQCDFFRPFGHKWIFLPRKEQENPFSDPPRRKKIVCDMGETLILLVWWLPSLYSGIKVYTRKTNFFLPRCIIYYFWPPSRKKSCATRGKHLFYSLVVTFAFLDHQTSHS